MPRAIELVRDAYALSNERSAGAKPGLLFVVTVNNPVATLSRVRTSPLHEYNITGASPT